MFYGWGTSSDKWALGDGNTLVFVYSYVSLMFIFKLAYKKKWFLVGDRRSDDVQISRDDLEQRYGDQLPSPGVWNQYGLVIGAAAIVVLAVVTSVL